jgi:hypothetical protein
MLQYNIIGIMENLNTVKHGLGGKSADEERKTEIRSSRFVFLFSVV